MATKIQRMEAPPTHFECTVEFDDISGERKAIDITFNYQTPAAHAALLDKLNAQSFPGVLSAEAITKKRQEANAVYFSELIARWGLEEQVSRENIMALITRYPAIVKSISEAYSAAIYEGRRGN